MGIPPWISIDEFRKHLMFDESMVIVDHAKLGLKETSDKS